MKIDSINYGDGIYYVVLTPNWLERLFGVTPKTKKLKPTGSTYTFGGLRIYRNEDGTKTGPHNDYAHAIDKWKNKF